SIVSNSGTGRPRRCGIRNRSDRANNTGVASIDAAEINVANAARSDDKAPTATAAPNSTKLNSLAWDSARPNRMALLQSHRAKRASSKAITVFPTSNVTVVVTKYN